jgi:altronate hydrolase
MLILRSKILNIYWTIINRRIVLEKRSLLIHPNDNVAVLLEHAHKGDSVSVGGENIILLEDIEFAHKVALHDFKTDDYIIKYGERIGHMLSDVKAGTWIHSHNMGCRRGKVKEGSGENK